VVNLPRVLIYIFDRFPVGFMSDLEDSLSKLKMEYPRHIMFFKVVPERKKLAILLRSSKRDVIERIDSVVGMIAHKFSVSVQSKINRRAKRKNIHIGTLARLLLMGMLLDYVYSMSVPDETTNSISSVEMLESEALMENDEILGKILLRKDVGFCELRVHIERLGLSRGELLVAIAMYMLKSGGDIESIVELSNWAFNMNYEDVLRIIKVLGDKKLVKVSSGEGRITLSLPLLISLRKTISLTTEILRRLKYISRKLEDSELLNKIGGWDILIFNKDVVERNQLRLVARKILAETNLTEGQISEENLIPILYLISRRRRVIGMSILKSIVAEITKLTG